MRRWGWTWLGAALVAAAGVGPADAQSPPSTYEEAIVQQWKAEHDKIVAMVRDFPEDLFDTRPHEDARSFLEEIRHVTIALEVSTAQLRGETLDYAARVAEDEGKPPTRASLLEEMEAAIAASYPLVEAGDSPALPRLVFWLGHAGEHYGKLVTIYRMNDLVPPISRGS